MQNNDDVVTAWLNGSDSSDGLENPAGSLYIEGQAATEAALAGTHMRATFDSCVTFVGGTSCSYSGGCLCC